MARNDISFSVKGIADLDVQGLTKNLNEAKNAISQLRLPSNLESTFNSLFKNINSQLNDFNSKATSTFRNMGDIREAEKSFNSLQKLVEGLQDRVSKIDMSKVSLKDSGGIAKQLESINNQLTSFSNSVNTTEKEINKLKKELSADLSAKVDTDSLIRAAQDGTRLRKVFDDLRKENNLNIQAGSDDVAKAEERVSKLREEILELEIVQGQARQAGGGGVNTEEYIRNSRAVKELREELKGAEREQRTLNDRVQALGNNASIIDRIQDSFKTLVNEAKSFNVDGVKQSLGDLNNLASSLEGEQFKQISEHISTATESSNGLANSLDSNVEPALREVVDAGNNIISVNQQMDALQNRFTQFFSIANGWNLVNRAIRNAYETVKELDAAMTEIAVVTDFSLDDVWSMRGDYSKEATALGAATIDMVDASKLYYQQGLNQAEVTEIATETIRFARIASLDGATATDLMTAAIRGFNLEMSEAARVNDVYSLLAAKTAADTLEIADAMTRTASIANSAGASFENTAAFLTQMIETTRESPENLGTALKTIIARFQEMKNSPDEIGEIDGEIVDANAIETALKTVGIALRDLNGDFRGFDDVILDISARWDSLTALQQRYIATTAAGSRQQSRFIALVQNNARLLELTGGAANSAGAANEQFEKTLDSLESKMNQMNNALALFWTNLADSDIVKGAIDLFTLFLDSINSIVGVLPGFTKGIASAAIAFAAFKGASKIIDRVFKEIGKSMGVAGTEMGKASGGKTGEGFINGLREKLSSGILDKEISNLEKKLDNVELTNFDRGQTEQQLAAFGKGFTEARVGAEEYAQGIKLLDNELVKNSGLTQQSLAYLSAREVQVLKNVTGSQLEAQATRLNTVAMARENVARTGLVGNIIKLAVNKAKLIAINIGLIPSTAASTAALQTETAATWAAVTAKYAYLGPLLLIGAAIAGLTIGLTAYSRSIVTNEKLLSQLNEALDKMANQAEAAQQAISDITSQNDSLRELEDTLDSLTVGTTEWKNALVQVNQSVLDLITKYPELASFVDRDMYGELTIRQEGFDEIIEQQQQNLNSALNTQLSLQAQRSQTQQTINTTVSRNDNSTGSNDDARTARIMSGIFSFGVTELIYALDKTAYDSQRESRATSATGVDNTAYQEIAAGFTEAGSLVEDLADASSLASLELRRLYTETTGINPDEQPKQFEAFIEEITANSEAFYNLGFQAQTTAAQVEAFKDTLISSTISQSEALSSLLESTSSAKVSDAIQGYADRMFADLNTEIADMASDLDVDAGKNNNKAAENAIIQEYAEITGKTFDLIQKELDSEDLTEDMIAQVVATERYTSMMEDAMLSARDTFDRLNRSASDADQALIRLASEEQGSVRQSDIDSLLEAFGQTDIASLQTSGLTNQDIMNVLGLSQEDFESLGFENVNDFIMALIIGQERLVNATQGISQYAPDLLVDEIFKSFTDGLSGAELEGIDRIFTDVLVKSGRDGANELANTLSGIFSNISSDTNRQSFIRELNSLDFSSSKSIRNFSNTLDDLGISVDEVDISNLERQLIDFANVIDSISVDGLTSALSQTFDLINDLEDRRPGDNTFSEEQMNQLIEEGVAQLTDFRFDGQDWVYVGNAVRELIPALRENTQALIQNAIDNKQAQAEIGQKIDNYMSLQTPEMASQYQNNTASEDQTRAFLMEALKFASNPQEQAALGYNEESLQAADLEQLRMFMEQALTLMASYEANQRMADQMSGSAGALGYEGTSGFQTVNNASGIGDYNLQNGGFNEGTAEQAKIATDALILQAQGYETLQGKIDTAKAAYEAYALAVQSGTEEEKEAAQASLEDANRKLELSTAVAEAAARLEEFDDVTKSSLDALKYSDAGTLDYINNLNLLTQATNDALGLNLSDKFFQEAENVELLSQALDGSEVAWQRFLLNADMAMVQSDAFASQFGLDAEYVAAVTAALDELVFDIDGTADMTKVVEALLAAGKTAEEVAEYLEALGYTNIEFSAETTPLELPDGTTVQMPTSIRATKVNIPAARQSSNFGGGGGARKAAEAAKAAKKSGAKPKAEKKEKEETPWENPYDWLYNLVQATNEEIRVRNKLEWQYSKLLKNSSKSALDLLNNVRAQEASLKQQQQYYDQQRSGRLTEQGRIEAEYSDLNRYANYNESAGVIEINWDAINSVTDQDTGKRIEEYISKLEQIQSEIHSIEDSQMDIIDQLEELAQLGREEYLTLEQRVLDAIIAQRQEEIEKLTAINDNITNSNQKVLDGIQQGINEQRAARDREEALSNIQEKERRLALLQSDSSGANALEIMQLQEELENDRQSYTDGLIDLAIQNIQEGNDVAAEQRQAQLELMQAQLDYQIESGELWKEAYAYLTEAFGKGGNIAGTQLEALLERYEGLGGMSTLQKDEWATALDEQIKAGFRWYMEQHKLENRSDLVGKQISFTDSTGQQRTGTVNSDGSVSVGSMKYRDLYQAPDGSWLTMTAGVNTAPPTPPPSSNSGGSSGQGQNFPAVSSSQVRAAGLDPYSIIDALKVATGNTRASNRGLWTAMGMTLSDIARKNGLSGYYGSESQNVQLLNLLRAGQLKRYKKGGLADYTGLAMLDGSRSNPEAVLNPEETKIFMRIPEIFKKYMSDEAGNVYYNIDIQVDGISNDYDVEQMMERMRKEIEDNARYRNVTALDLRRR